MDIWMGPLSAGQVTELLNHVKTCFMPIYKGVKEKMDAIFKVVLKILAKRVTGEMKRKHPKS